MLDYSLVLNRITVWCFIVLRLDVQSY